MKKVITKLPAGRIVGINELPDGRFEVVQEVAEEVVCEHKGVSENNIILIEAESLSTKDRFMCYEPITYEEKETKELILEVIENKVKNFYRPIMDPSFTDDGIDYVAGKEPAVGKSYFWWDNTANKYDPSRNSRLGTRLQYGAFLGVLIKKLVEEGKSVEWAWNAVCNDSKELGHYKNSKNGSYDFEPTGSRCICGFYDLANTYKILAADEELGGFWIVGGNLYNFSNTDPLADYFLVNGSFGAARYSVGWIVLS